MLTKEEIKEVKRGIKSVAIIDTKTGRLLAGRGRRR